MKTFVIVLVGLVLIGLVAIPFVARRSVQSRIGPEHVFAFAEQSGSFTQEYALARARETLARDGLETSVWQEAVGNRQVISNRVVVMFTNSAASTRFVHVALDGQRVVCQASIGK
jgi:hypothetical protein